MIDRPKTSICLTRNQVEHGALVGVRRHLDNLYRDNAVADRAFGARGDDWWRANIEGACGEYAAALWLGIEWTPRMWATRHLPDLPPDIEVRTTNLRRGDRRWLAIRAVDRPQRRYLLVWGAAPDFELVGWIAGVNGMVRANEAFSEGGRWWAVPEQDLRSPALLLDSARSQGVMSAKRGGGPVVL